MIGNVLRGSIGNLVEWYDWYAYAAFTTYFAKSFFPTTDTTAAFLGTAAVFAVGFLMRPLGGWMLGRFADRFGRRSALVLSVTLMAGGSLLIAVTPSYATIGVAAPILLLVARLIQGLSVGGEYSTSATYLSEVATPGKRGFYSSFQYVTLYGGQLLALGLQLILQAPAHRTAADGVGLADRVRRRHGRRAQRDVAAPRHGRVGELHRAKRTRPGRPANAARCARSPSTPRRSRSSSA